MNGRFLLDTDIVLAIFANDRAVVEQLEDAEEIFVPSLVLGELYYGARRTGNSRENIAWIYEFAEANTILLCDAETARWYGVLKDLLRQKNSLMPENDVWIAALALQYGLVLVTRDPHFQAVTNLKTAYW